MHKTHQMERFSNAYLQAVAAAAGCSLAQPVPDDESVDWTLGASIQGIVLRSPRIDVQLKCSHAAKIGKSWVQFRLKRKNYDELRPTNLIVPRILVLLAVPKDVVDWLVHSENDLLLRRCAYWHSLRGEPAHTGKSGVGIKIPRTQLFSPDVLQQMMKRIADGGTP